MDSTLPPRLEALLAAEADTDFAARLRMVCLTAARTIAALGELDLVQYEEGEAGSADLSTWEQVAPIVAATLSDVNVLGAQIDASFPPGAVVLDPRQLEVERVVSQAREALRGDVVAFGQRVRDPSVVGDRWNLLTELQMFRARFRDRIGQLVWEAASTLGDGRRRDLEPGYEEALSATLVVRSMTADLRRKLHARLVKVSEAAPEELPAHVQSIARDLDAFGRTAAWRNLRAQDKRGILEFRERLRRTEAVAAPTKFELLEVLEPFIDFVDGFVGINQRELLRQHDQEAQAAIGRVLERAMSAERDDEKLSAYREALELAQPLYGRAGAFDAWLREQRKGLPPPEQVSGAVEQFLVQLAGLSQ